MSKLAIPYLFSQLLFSFVAFAGITVLFAMSSDSTLDRTKEFGSDATYFDVHDINVGTVVEAALTVSATVIVMSLAVDVLQVLTRVFSARKTIRRNPDIYTKHFGPLSRLSVSRIALLLVLLIACALQISGFNDTNADIRVKGFISYLPFTKITLQLVVLPYFPLCLLIGITSRLVISRN